MGAPVNFCLRADQLILLVLFGLILPSIEPSTDYTALVYKSCAKEKLRDRLAAAAFHKQTLASLFNELVSHSLQSKFFRATAGDVRGGISGFYQCRRDITNEDCHGCVAKLPDISNSLCDRAIAAKIQLAGCSLHYETDSFSQAKEQLPVGRVKYEAEHKVCSRERVEIEGFDELRDLAFEELESEVVVEHGYSTVEKEGFRAVARCEEEMGESECGECVNHALEIAKEACERAVYGKVFLDHCSVSYEFGRGGGEGGIGGEGGGGGEGGFGGEGGIGGEGGFGGGFPFPGDHEGEGEGENHSGRQVAIILGGGAAAVLIGLIFLGLLGCSRKKDDC